MTRRVALRPKRGDKFYDPIGNLTNVAYPASGTVKFSYDALNRLTNMVDSLGTTHYTYDGAGQLLTEGGLFSSDVLTNTSRGVRVDSRFPGRPSWQGPDIVERIWLRGIL